MKVGFKIRKQTDRSDMKEMTWNKIDKRPQTVGECEALRRQLQAARSRATLKASKIVSKGVQRIARHQVNII